ncbi:hypothetical protein Cri9333_1174 [Crinalium epipsammum PCC 9333]|uniref:Uncharacterized protein n=1 Tax=Crinalium epipsammum PCC 9333 TaxID=1173022 RepID=K9VX06_9CYAN|nr:hypothetical protein [Crinalium epipsammum]AFZ12079.1 hypothetical protein Cri9333_1174 [Crinalium epipsammum PCC 9333]
MKIQKLYYLLFGILLLTTAIPSVAQSHKNVTPSTKLTTTLARTETQRPPTKTATIYVEGEKTPVTLKLYKQSSPKFSTYYPDQFFVSERLSSDEGTRTYFYVNTTGTKKTDAYVSVGYLNFIKNLGQLKQFVDGKRGLIAFNGWQVTNRTKKLPYAWAKEKISFQQRKDNQLYLGNVILGQSKGQTFYVITYYPAEYGDGFSPRENLILQNLQLGS